jgi:hypothetical protein
VEQLEETLRMREVLVMQYVLDERGQRRSKGHVDEETESSALLFAILLNDRVPVRFRLSDLDFDLMITRYSRLSKREFLKQVYRAWRAFGRPVVRGQRFPPIAMGKQMVEMLFDALREMSAAAG